MEREGDGEMAVGMRPLEFWDKSGRPWVDPLPNADDPWVHRESVWPPPEGRMTIRRCPHRTMMRAEGLIRAGHLDHARWFLFEQKYAAAPAIRSLGREDWNQRLDRCVAELERREGAATRH